MVRFLKFKFLTALKSILKGVNFINIKIWLFQKVEKSHNKIVKFEVENFKHLHLNTRLN